MCDAIGQRGSLDQLHHERADIAGLLEAIHVGDVGMVQRGKRLGLTLEACETFGVVREGIGQYLDRDVARQARVPGTIHFPHTSGAEERDDLEGAEASACR